MADTHADRIRERRGLPAKKPVKATATKATATKAAKGDS